MLKMAAARMKTARGDTTVWGLNKDVGTIQRLGHNTLAEAVHLRSNSKLLVLRLPGTTNSNNRQPIDQPHLKRSMACATHTSSSDLGSTTNLLMMMHLRHHQRGWIVATVAKNSVKMG